ncbi:putative serine/threonine-protein kinase HSL1 [Cladobotryum mycophilum]|uniref:non-specific serine/threonine protein kinase n=1 Tax=Cladobotryum mycophilum TaxID=491253 RepID=A0ABR0ST88_9HYPO
MAETSVYKARQPLAEASNRINSHYPSSDQQTHKARYSQSDIPQPRVHHRTQSQHHDARTPTAANAPAPVPRPQSQAIDESKRFSQASYASTSSSRSRSYKTHIGPWQLGKTLGKGSSARVRLCRHNVTNQLAAVKIVNRRMAYLVQDSSLAALSKYDSSLPEINGEMRVPMAIEREVAILKLIEHPNIMKLYDIWENRSEIYLIVEYIDQGDLFTFINSKGRLSEEVAIYFFRQIISAIAYCHSFNVCHRDLKPENILITADLQIKIADFGMAALHQTDSHRLVTACGSPHYAAPELLKNRHYRGDRADIWSLGVILYAMLSATLPFDDPDLRIMMSKTKKGQYEMPKFLSPEAEDLIRRILQVNPDRRTTLKEIWNHPLVQKYSYLDDFGDLSGQLPDTLKGFRYNPIQSNEIDPQLLRQLHSMWHIFTEQELAAKLSCPEPNDQKAFYWLLHNYREKQLEDFKPELSHSMSDYHHLKPAIWKKRVSTCQFAQPRGNGHGRSVSRFTVISNTAETEAGTVNSYDPYRGSRILKTSNSKVSHARITVHRDNQPSVGNQTMQPRRHSSHINSTRTMTTRRSQLSRGSMTSLRNSRQGTPNVHGPILRHKRGVDFSHIRKRSSSAARMNCGSRRSVTTGSTTDQTEKPRSTTPEMPLLSDGTHPKARRSRMAEEMSLFFNEELRHFSDNIAKDCDEAFRSSLIEDDSVCGSVNDGDRRYRESTPFSFTIDTPSEATAPTEFSNKSWSSRPLPPLPFDEDGPMGHSRPSSMDENDGSTSDYPTDETSRLALPVLMPKHADRRVVSAPTYTQINKRPGTLPSIKENSGVAEKSRIVSAPPHASSKRVNQENGGIEYLTKVEHSIRVVDSPGGQSPVKMPKPLNVRKKTQKEDLGRVLHRQLAYNAEGKKSWFKLSFKAEGEVAAAAAKEPQDQKPRAASRQTHRSNQEATASGSKKRHFSFPFWKSNRNRDSKMMIEDDLDDQSIVMKTNRKNQGLQKSSSGASRNIEVKQNWFARLFRVKPATNYICLTLSRKRARQETAILLREWRKYGIKGVQVDKERNIVFARIGAKNYLDLKEVAFAAEVMTVIEHGKKQPLSIVRFTQERGAASSFHKVVDTMRIVFASRNLLVTDRNKQKMMIKTLNS